MDEMIILLVLCLCRLVRTFTFLLHVMPICMHTETLPQATDKSFVEKLYMHCSKHRFFEKPRFGALEFMIKHYAGKVSYTVTGFLEKV